VKSTHVQFALYMAGAKLARSNEPSGYDVILISQEHIVVNYRDIHAV